MMTVSKIAPTQTRTTTRTRTATTTTSTRTTTAIAIAIAIAIKTATATILFFFMCKGTFILFFVVVDVIQQVEQKSYIVSSNVYIIVHDIHPYIL